MLEGEIITLQITASDPDGTVSVIFMDSCPVPYSFIDHHNGTATVEFRPGCTDHGIYEISIYGSDGIDTVKDTFTLTIGDVNFDPVFDTTSYYIAWETKEFTATFRVFDCDGTIPEIRIKIVHMGPVSPTTMMELRHYCGPRTLTTMGII